MRVLMLVFATLIALGVGVVGCDKPPTAPSVVEPRPIASSPPPQPAPVPPPSAPTPTPPSVPMCNKENFVIDDKTQSFTWQGGSGFITVGVVDSRCGWTARREGQMPWVDFTKGPKGPLETDGVVTVTGNGTANFNVAGSDGRALRSGAILVFDTAGRQLARVSIEQRAR